MTEKRFTIEIWQEGSLFYRDDKEGFSTHNSTGYVTNLVENKLNELSEENEQLKNKYIDEFSLRETLQQELQRVEYENEQLKKFKEQVKKELQESYELYVEATIVAPAVINNLAKRLGFELE